ncbi:CDP-alcohol phosphatidyltransferase family protein [Leptothrix discophora]|uniref:CDP-alcohol phosphatidyltransferase family protein n=1 Tax=Leptothrix discophora TaxID=89 RepID=A0ABT9FYE8_LEPDI|nr:CDP-alcohol phosphatidyltransferase family protein [Leptothrix discophora]MDP4299260.1 CDP-alcohol phosphatidyltransferase family protein [Leptothrix discophora]
MLDAAFVARFGPPLERLAARLARTGLSPDGLSWTGFGLGLAAAAAIVEQVHVLALALILASRLADGLDGALARHLGRASARGAYLDITLDFLFYALVPLAFAWSDPAANSLAGATLLAAFMGTGSSFLAYAVLAERHGLRSVAFPRKGFYYLGGLTEAGETLACFAAMCLWPQHFALLAYGFAALCGLTVAMRVQAGWRCFGALDRAGPDTRPPPR